MNAKIMKQKLFDVTEAKLKAQGFSIVEEDRNRPWGGFFVIDENQAQKFSDTYFDNIPVDQLKISGKLSPKILIVQPEKRLSWQYHHRRAEIWKVVEGPVGIITSPTNEQGPLKRYQPGDQITLQKGERHRLIGLDDWGIVAEIWQHTDKEHPSDEDDIVRVEDDFGRGD
jgi:mannose-6-phosphate isomerase-like protein (cupin superfamily)